jgi:hypothetical protein
MTNGCYNQRSKNNQRMGSERPVSLGHVGAFIVLLGLPTLFFIIWVGFWIFLRRVPPWFLVVAAAVSTAHIVVAWGMTIGDPPRTEGDQDIISFYAALANGITGMVSVVMLAVATAIIQWARMSARSRASRTPST